MSLSSRVRVSTSLQSENKGASELLHNGHNNPMEASCNSFIPNFADSVQIVEIHTVGIRRKCAFFRQTDFSPYASAKLQFFFHSAKSFFNFIKKPPQD